MSTFSLIAVTALALSLGPMAAAQETPPSSPYPRAADQVIYKGLLGNVLDTLPIDPEERVNLQRTNAVVSNIFSGRSLGLLAGVGGPLMIVAGLVWGVWSASNINAAALPPAAEAQPPVARAGAPRASGHAGAEKGPDASPEPAMTVVVTAAFEAPAAAPPHVIKVWLPQRVDASLAGSRYR